MIARHGKGKSHWFRHYALNPDYVGMACRKPDGERNVFGVPPLIRSNLPLECRRCQKLLSKQKVKAC